MKTFDDLGARMMTFDDLRALFEGAWWLAILDQLTPGTPVHFFEGSLSVDDLVAGDGPWVVIVHGDLHASGTLDFSTSDYRQSLLVVRGSVYGTNFRYSNGAHCIVSHDLVMRGYVFGQYGDENAVLSVENAVRARALLLDHVTPLGAKEIDAIVCTTAGWDLPLDIDYEAEVADIFDAAVLARTRHLDLHAAWGAARRGERVLLEEAEQRLRCERPRRRRARSNSGWVPISDSPAPGG